ncbi:MAG: hypothetical protein PVJ57_22735 [Phycisphaerae bacterium]|jgi:hypothetical protein
MTRVGGRGYDAAGSDVAVEVTGADTTPGALSDKVVAGANVSITTLNPGANERLEIAVEGGAPLLQGWEVYPVAASENSVQIWAGVDGGSGDYYAALVFPTSQTGISSMACYFTQVTGTASLQMAIYDVATGDRVAITGFATPVVGLNTVALVAPVTLDPGRSYYFAVWCNENSAMALYHATFNGAGAPTLSFEGVNKSLPVSVGTDVSNKKTESVWVAGF